MTKRLRPNAAPHSVRHSCVLIGPLTVSNRFLRARNVLTRYNFSVTAPNPDADHTPLEAIDSAFAWPTPKRIDLHCHSLASTKTTEKSLDFIRCPESYSPPEGVYEQAKLRGMDFVTITDHDTIAGVTQIAGRSDVLVGEELTCWFPEDDCKLHLLVYGITPEQHDKLQSLARNIYDVAAYIEAGRIAHSVAHPIYRQNDKLERWHLERLLLLFKGFECLNGAHMQYHREAFEPVLDRLTREEIERLASVHNLRPRWPEPWVKARTAGSDDHGLLNIGISYTEFPPTVKTVDDILTCLRQGQCRPAGEAGSTLKLAHTFYGVALRYNAHQLEKHDRTPGTASILLQTLVGARKAPTKFELGRSILRGKVRKARTRVKQLFGYKVEEPSGLIRELFLDSLTKQVKGRPEIWRGLHEQLPLLARHTEMFELFNAVNSDVLKNILDHATRATKRGSLIGLTDAMSAFVAQQLVLAPYYFALFHQNKERHLVPRITRQETLPRPETIRVGLFTDTFDDINGVGRFIRDMGEQSLHAGYKLTIHTSGPEPKFALPNRKNFAPMLSKPIPYYQTLSLSLPPVLEMLEWADRKQFDVIHVSTPGPVGLVGMLVAKMLRVPMVTTYHTDFPAYVENLTHDARLTRSAEKYMRWFYKRSATVFSRSGAYHFNLRELGVPQAKLRTISPGINTTKFNRAHEDHAVWQKYGVDRPFKLLYVGRISVEKNLPLLAEAFKLLCRKRGDAALIIAGEGPYEPKMKEALAGLPATFTGPLDDAALGKLYASADVFTFPSRTDTLGQVVMEAQASGLPTLVSPEGGPREIIEPDVTGLVINGTDPKAWADAIDRLLDSPVRRSAMSSAAIQRSRRYDLRKTFDSFWSEHLEAIRPEPHEAIAPMPSARK